MGSSDRIPTETRWDRGWAYVIDVALTVWVLRAPIFAVALGAFILLLVPQAQDLLVEAATDVAVPIAIFTFLLVFVWAMPTHYAARLLLETDDRYRQRIADRNNDFIKSLQKLSPRVLAACTFLAMIGSAFRSRANIPTVSSIAGYSDDIRSRLVYLAIFIAAVMLLFCLYTIYRREWIAATGVVQALERVLQRLLRPLRRLLSHFALTAHPSDGAGGESTLGPVLLIGLFVVFSLLPCVWPFEFAEYLPRAAAVPFVMGGWIPLVTLLSGLGRRYRVPFIVIGLFLLAVLPAVIGDNYEVRLVNNADQSRIANKAILQPATASDQVSAQTLARAGASGLPLKEAVELWKKRNCDGSGCDRPIIIAAAGGASRAGFFTASVIGQLLDDALVVDGGGHGLKPGDLRDRIFALSTVSGSSVGAVMTVAALAASKDGTQPCTKTPSLWHGAGKQKIDSWRSCLEALMTGDFLTPAFAGFVFHDVFRFIGGLVPWQDRGTLLERSIEAQFSLLVEGRRDPQGLACVGNLECPFRSLVPNDKRWLPLLVLNSTSVGTGQRIINTPLAETFQAIKSDVPCPAAPRKDPCPLFSYAPLFRNLLKGDSQFDDVRLSTAAHNSARFPLLSPPGVIVNSAGVVVDRVVDGGYFENLGAQTATEIAEAILAIDNDLQPFVLVISNDPHLVNAKAEGIQEQTTQAQASKAQPEKRKSAGQFLADLAGPLFAFINTRNARGVLAVNDVGAILDSYQGRGSLDQNETRDICNVAHIQVWGEKNADGSVRDVSWSWWLSKPVQIFLHEQTTFPNGKDSIGAENARHIRYLLDALADREVRGQASEACSID